MPTRTCGWRSWIATFPTNAGRRRNVWVERSPLLAEERWMRQAKRRRRRDRQNGETRRRRHLFRPTRNSCVLVDGRLTRSGFLALSFSRLLPLYGRDRRPTFAFRRAPAFHGLRTCVCL